MCVPSDGKPNALAYPLLTLDDISDLLLAVDEPPTPTYYL